MACTSCGNSQSARAEMMTVARTGVRNRLGGHTLGTYPDDCVPDPYGKYSNLTIFVIGRHTPEERLYRYNELAEAQEYSRLVFRQPEAMNTAEVCAQAVLDTYTKSIIERYPEPAVARPAT